MTGQVIKGVGGIYYVRTDSGVVACAGRGRLRMLGEIYVGDRVEISVYNNGKGAIERILPRTSLLIRPYIANVEAIVICIAPVPKPDFTLVDKLLINCLSENIEPIICVNKLDIADKEFIDFVHSNYDGLAKIALVSAESGAGIDNLIDIISGKYVCMSGQSAVGKSSIINRITGSNSLNVGGLSRKTARGKHCTRHIEIFDIGRGIRLADTCGFSVLELPDLPPDELSTYFTDFDKYADKCKYRGCNHIGEPDCAVREAAASGKLAKERYERYVNLYKECDKNWRNRYE